MARINCGSRVPARHVFVAVKVLNSFAYALMSSSMALATASMAGGNSAGGSGAAGGHVTAAGVTAAGACPASTDRSGGSHARQAEGEFDWDELTQSLVNSVATYGSLLTIMVGARLADWWSPRSLLATISLLYTAVYMLTPVLARWSVQALIVSRALYGLLMGPSRPATSALDAAWLPPAERQVLTGIVVAALNVGAIVSTSLSGFLIERLGWEVIFYLYGGLHMWTSALYVFLVYDSPELHPRISEQERLYILTSTRKDTKLRRSVPWLQILKSRPFWAHNAVIIGVNWLTFMFNTELPLYLSKVLHFKTSKIGYFSSLPHAATWFGQLFFGFLARWIRKNRLMSQLTQYRIFNAIAMFGPAAALVALALSGCDPGLAAGLLVLTTFLQAAHLAGSLLNHMDLAVNHVASLSGLSETLAGLAGAASPLVAGAILDRQETLTSWSKIFYISAAFSSLPYVVFFVFGSAEEQPWNRAEDTDLVDGEVGVDVAGTDMDNLAGPRRATPTGPQSAPATT